MSEEEIRAFLVPPRVAVLATLGRDGWPHLSGMWFLVEPGSLRMWTYAKSQKAVNARRDPRGSILVEEGTSYPSLKGVSFRGSLRVIDGFEEVRAIGIGLYDRYTKPDLGVEVDAGPIDEIEKQARKRIGLVLEIDDITSWDHSKLS